MRAARCLVAPAAPPERRPELLRRDAGTGGRFTNSRPDGDDAHGLAHGVCAVWKSISEASMNFDARAGRPPQRGVAPGQHEMSPIFLRPPCPGTVMCSSWRSAPRSLKSWALAVLFHEKPFAGINGNGKHANWSVGTDTVLNFFYPKTEEGALLFVTALACLAHGLLSTMNW